MAKATCPECDADVVRDDPRVGDTIKCRECGMTLEIVSDRPFELDYADDDGW